MCLSKYHFDSSIVLLQCCLGSHIIFYRLKKTSLLGTDPCKNHIIIENNNDENDQSLYYQLIAIGYFFKVVQPSTEIQGGQTEDSFILPIRFSQRYCKKLHT